MLCERAGILREDDHLGDLIEVEEGARDAGEHRFARQLDQRLVLYSEISRERVYAGAAAGEKDGSDLAAHSGLNRPAPWA
jgi:hypothetical protein